MMIRMLEMGKDVPLIVNQFCLVGVVREEALQQKTHALQHAGMG